MATTATEAGVGHRWKLHSHTTPHQPGAASCLQVSEAAPRLHLLIHPVSEQLEQRQKVLGPAQPSQGRDLFPKWKQQLFLQKRCSSVMAQNPGIP